MDVYILEGFEQRLDLTWATELVWGLRVGFKNKLLTSALSIVGSFECSSYPIPSWD